MRSYPEVPSTMCYVAERYIVANWLKLLAEDSQPGSKLWQEFEIKASFEDCFYIYVNTGFKDVNRPKAWKMLESKAETFSQWHKLCYVAEGDDEISSWEKAKAKAETFEECRIVLKKLSKKSPERIVFYRKLKSQAKTFEDLSIVFEERFILPYESLEEDYRNYLEELCEILGELSIQARTPSQYQWVEQYAHLEEIKNLLKKNKIA